MNYIKQLDSLRAIAALLVIISHWFAPTHYINILFPNQFNGDLGVTFFFVLSGFLITSILLRNLQDNSDKWTIIKNFYIRRALRIFPIYYLTVFSFVLFSKGDEAAAIKSNILWYLLYGTNILTLIEQRWLDGLAHSWSLAVEEQFYLIWPLLMVYYKKHQLYVILLSILVGITSSLFLPFIFPGSNFVSVLTPTCFDSFGLGALLAYFNISRNELSLFKKYLYLVALLAFMSVLLNLYLSIDTGIPLRTLVSIISLALIAYVNQTSSPLDFILGNRILIWMGKISYGLYLYHFFLPRIYGDSKILILMGGLIPSVLHGEVLVFEHISSLLMLSWLSWVFIEKPITNMKCYFEYQSRIHKHH